MLHAWSNFFNTSPNLFFFFQLRRSWWGPCDCGLCAYLNKSLLDFQLYIYICIHIGKAKARSANLINFFFHKYMMLIRFALIRWTNSFLYFLFSFAFCYRHDWRHRMMLSTHTQYNYINTTKS